MKFKSLACCFLIIAFAHAAAAVEALNGANPYHPASSAAEKALDAIVMKAGNDMFVLDNLFHGRPLSDASKAVDYSTLLTPALLSAMTAAQTTRLQQTCGGKYLPDQSCGLNFNPIACGQDVSSSYLYDTTSATALTATIASKWPDQSYINIYRLVNDGKSWKIDGIECGGIQKFNVN